MDKRFVINVQERNPMKNAKDRVREIVEAYAVEDYGTIGECLVAIDKVYEGERKEYQKLLNHDSVTIRNLGEKLDRLNNSAQFRRVEMQQEEITSLKAENERLGSCEHKGCEDKDVIRACHTHINTDYPCIECKELKAKLSNAEVKIKQLETGHL